MGTWGSWVTKSAAFTYDWGMTPSITKITPAKFGSALTTKIEVRGDFSAFNKGSGSCKASLRFVSPSGLYRECNALKIHADRATCIVIRGKSFPASEQQKMFPRLQLCSSGGQAVVAHPEPNCCSAAPFQGRIDIALRIASTFPKSGSLAGGSKITIKGSGFANLHDTIVRSSLTSNYHDEMTVVRISTDHRYTTFGPHHFTGSLLQLFVQRFLLCGVSSLPLPRLLFRTNTVAYWKR